LTQQSPVDAVAGFYRAIGDADAIGTVIDDAFSADATIERPPALPHGGRIVGAKKLRGLFTAIARPDSSMVWPTNLAPVRVLGADDKIVARITFDWTDPRPEPACRIRRWNCGRSPVGGSPKSSPSTGITLRSPSRTDLTGPLDPNNSER
jgi:hypothetical protein